MRLVVVHRMVGSYTGSVEYLCTPKAQASAHVLIREDGGEATQLVPWSRKAWACASFNSASDNIETPDHIWTLPLVEDRLRVMRVCARVVAFRLHERRLPAAWRTGADLLELGGVTRHFDLGNAGGGHTDPTTDTTRWVTFMELVEAELARGHFRKSWGRV